MRTTEGQSPAPLELRRFIDHVPALGWSALPDGSLEYVNQRFRDYTGLSPDELYGSGWKSAVHREDIQPLESWSQKLLQSREAGTTEVRLRRFDGSYRWFLVFANPLRDESGSMVAWYGTNIDIEDRKQAEATLRTRELSWLQIVDNIPGLVATMGATGEVEFLNRQTLDYFGKSNEDLKNWALSNAVHPDDLPRIIQARIKSIEEGGIYDVEHRCRRADGVYRWFQVRGIPVRNAEDTITAWYLLLTDIDDRKRTEEQLRERELNLRQITQTIPGMLWSTRPEGEVDYCNRPWLDFTAMTAEQAMGWGWTVAIYPDDRDNMIERWRSCLASGTPFDTEARVRRFDGAHRWFLFRANPLRDESGKIVKWYGSSADIEDSKRREEVLRASEISWRQIIDNIPGFVTTTGAMGEVQFFNHQTLEYFGKTPEELRDWTRIGIVHPDDLPHEIEAFSKSLETGQILDIETRLRRADGVYRWFQTRGIPVRNAEGTVTSWNILLTDIDDRKRAEEKVRQSEQDLRTITETIPQPIVVLAPNGNTLYVNQRALDITGYSWDRLDERGYWARVVHPDDVKRLRPERQQKLLSGVPFELEFRVLYKSGQYRWILMQYNPLKDESGQTLRWYSTATDIHDRKRAEEKLRQSEAELRTITDTVRQPIIVFEPDGTLLYANRVALNNSGLTMDEVKRAGFLARVCHPDDVERALDERNRGLSKAIPFDSETRILFKDGEYRWQLIQYNPLKDESGQINRWYATATDIDDQKRKEERLRNENLVLREEIDRSSMFEEIVGSCKPMQQVLRQVEKVAPSDSTVLILGETGTGKELIARALHRRSKRANRAFVKVNCAAIPESLIASELFGHEKGAFTGALQRRVGRFEAANGGTLFLDEVGDLPMETQIALLRVLQEKEFERVGSNHPISVDVRLIAATNRDLPAAVADGTFRQDLFYRLNVFPIAVPTLHERVDDIPLLVEYFVGRFAKDAGKNIRHIGKQTLQQIKGYTWPGNIRELQNVVERAVVLCEGDTFVVDESWLKREPASQDGLSALADREVEMIEAALAETHGRISGPSGAAAKLGIPRQTLESKIRRLGIDRYGQKGPASS
jgi:PAS domain S-box-containing protein